MKSNKPEYLFLHHTAGNENPMACVDMWNDDTRGRIATEFVVGGVEPKDGEYIWLFVPNLVC